MNISFGTNFTMDFQCVVRGNLKGVRREALEEIKKLKEDGRDYLTINGRAHKTDTVALTVTDSRGKNLVKWIYGKQGKSWVDLINAISVEKIDELAGILEEELKKQQRLAQEAEQEQAYKLDLFNRIFG